MFACGYVSWTGEISCSFNLLSVVARAGIRPGGTGTIDLLVPGVITPEMESGHYDATFNTPLSNHSYTIIIQPYIKRGHYRLISDVMEKLPTGFTFRIPGTYFAVKETFMFTCIRY